MSILGLPPLVVLVIVVALAAYMIYHIAATGAVEPMTVIILLFLGFVLIRVLWRLMHKSQENEID